MLVGQRRAEDFVIDPEVLAVDARLGDAGRAAGLEDEDRFAGQATGHPPLHGTAAKPFVFEQIEQLQVVESRDALARIPPEFLRVVEPEGAAGGRYEVPRDDSATPRIERRTGGLRL